MPLPFRSIHEITLRIVLVSATTNAEKSFVTLSSIKRFRGHPDHRRPGGHVLCYHRPGPDGNFVADFKILQDRRARADEATRAHLHAARHVDSGIEHATVRDTHVVPVSAVQVEEIERANFDVGGEDVSRTQNIAAAKRDARLVAYDARMDQVWKTDVRLFGETGCDLVNHSRRADTDCSRNCLIQQLFFRAVHAILSDLLSDALAIGLDEAEDVPLRRSAVDLVDQKRDLARESTTAEDDDVLHSANEALVKA